MKTKSHHTKCFIQSTLLYVPSVASQTPILGHFFKNMFKAELMKKDASEVQLLQTKKQQQGFSEAE